MLTKLRARRDARALERARAASAAGDFGRALAAMTAVADRSDRPDVEQQIVALRHRAFLDSEHRPGLAAWPPQPSDELDSAPDGLVEVGRDGLMPATLADGILRHGSLVVRGLLTDEAASRLRQAVRHAHDAYDRHVAGAPAPPDGAWFSPFEPAPGRGFPDIVPRPWVRDGGGVLAADSPRALRLLLDEFEAAGVIDVIAGHLGERPALSVLKTTLRCVPAEFDAEVGWHQDGAFLGQAIRTVNVWVALSDCGVSAPALDLVPRRLDRLVPTGTPGAAYDWSVSAQLVDDLCPATGPARPVFAPGDAILFDEMSLHRTAVTAEMVDPRYAIEAWFFAPSTYPMAQIPIHV